LWVATVVAALTGCHQEVHLFGVESGHDPGDFSTATVPSSIALREDPAQDESAEGYMLPGEGATPRYVLQEPHRVAPGGESWAFAFTDMDRPLSIVIHGEGDEVLARRSVAGPVAGIQDSVVLVPLQGSVEVTWFQVLVDRNIAYDARAADAAGQPSGGTVRLTAVARVPPAGASPSGAVKSGGSLILGSDVQVDAWRNQDEGAVVWSVRPETDRWYPDTPVEIGYHYDPKEPDVALSEPTAEIVIPSVELTIGDWTGSAKIRPGTNRFVVYPRLYGAAATEVTVRSVVDGFEVERITPVMSAGNPGPDGFLSPLPADLGTVVDYPAELWRSREFEIFRWTLFPEILVMDTRDYGLQARFFKRLAFFVEKEVIHGQLLTDAELASLHGYNAHNYNGAGLAAFFNEAERLAAALTDEEIQLRGLVEHEGIIVRSGGRYEAGDGGILSISQESWQTPGLRGLLLTHEAYHGVYYASGAYVEQIHALWQSLSADEQRFWTLMLDGMQYDTTNQYLMENEFHAYLLQQPVDYAQWYFERRSIDRLRAWKPHEAAWLNQFLIDNEGTFLEQAASANAILFSLTGLVGGDVFCLEPAIR
jgi:hypothetical protein